MLMHLKGFSRRLRFDFHVESDHILHVTWLPVMLSVKEKLLEVFISSLHVIEIDIFVLI